MNLRFGEFVLDRGTRQLRRGAEERHLGPKASELLELLLRHRPKRGRQAEIHDSASVVLEDDDEFRLGRVRLRPRILPADAATRTDPAR